MAQTQEAMTQKLAERLYCKAARRDDAAAGEESRSAVGCTSCAMAKAERRGANAWRPKRWASAG
jgi:hypothetical protein